MKHLLNIKIPIQNNQKQTFIYELNEYIVEKIELVSVSLHL